MAKKWQSDIPSYSFEMFSFKTRSSTRLFGAKPGLPKRKHCTTVGGLKKQPFWNLRPTRSSNTERCRASGGRGSGAERPRGKREAFDGLCAHQSCGLVKGGREGRFGWLGGVGFWCALFLLFWFTGFSLGSAGGFSFFGSAVWYRWFLFVCFFFGKQASSCSEAMLRQRGLRLP